MHSEPDWTADSLKQTTLELHSSWVFSRNPKTIYFVYKEDWEAPSIPQSLPVLWSSWIVYPLCAYTELSSSRLGAASPYNPTILVICSCCPFALLATAPGSPSLLPRPYIAKDRVYYVLSQIDNGIIIMKKGIWPTAETPAPGIWHPLLGFVSNCVYTHHTWYVAVGFR